LAQSRFVVVGGGTAGWITAFILQDSIKRLNLDAKVSVVESSKIPTVGVGEATTAAFHVFLRHFNIDIFDFMRSCEATYKLGIRHEDWRRKGVTYYGPIDDPHQVVEAPAGAPSDYLNVYAVSVQKPVQDMHLFGPLLERKKAPWTTKPDDSLLALGPFLPAYHFDQALVGKYLKAHSDGVEIVDNVLTGVERHAETGDVTAIVFEDGQKLEGDFFIDATGFRKRLIVGEMQAPWISYQHELPVNRALPFWLPIEEGEEIANYTRAWAQQAGWMWQIPTQFRYGCGYVFSDEFQTPDEAHAEIERVLGRKVEVRGDIQFKIGRLEKAWINNVMAVGLSSNFLEPLESTSIHGTIVQMMMFGGQYLRDPKAMTQAMRDDYNARVGRQVDDFRTFVNTHYLTERDDTPFWREVRANRIHPETKERLARWRTEMPRHEHFPNYLFGLPHMETQLHYPVLDGLGLLDPAVAKAEMARDPKLRSFAKNVHDAMVKEYKQAATKALGHAEFLKGVRERRWN
jgi:2-polyprenyl-6-methoxyphenol hydroxylase-like FAD-dependent oxidoreductase